MCAASRIRERQRPLDRSVTKEGIPGGIVLLKACNEWSDGRIAHQCNGLHFFLVHKWNLLCLFYQYKEARKESPVRLCGFEKEKVRGAFNLHELSGKGIQAACGQCRKGMQGDGLGQKALAPESEITP